MFFKMLFATTCLLIGFQVPSSAASLPEEQVRDKFGKPTYTQRVKREDWWYYLGQIPPPDFLLKIRDGIVVEKKWIFAQHPLIAVGQTTLATAPLPQDLMRVGNSARQWFDELQFFAPWRTIKSEDRNRVLDRILEAAKTFGEEKVLLPSEHHVIRIITSNKLQEFLDASMKSDDSTIDIIALIRKQREELLKK